MARLIGITPRVTQHPGPAIDARDQLFIGTREERDSALVRQVELPAMTPHDFCRQEGRTEAELLHGLLFRGLKLKNGLGVLLRIQRPCFLAQARQMVNEFIDVLNHVLLLRHVFPEVELTKISIAWVLKVLLHAVHDVLILAE